MFDETTVTTTEETTATEATETATETTETKLMTDIILLLRKWFGWKGEQLKSSRSKAR